MSLGADQGQDAEMEGLGGAAPTASFGKYHLFASLGRGGMADVYLSVARGPMGFNKLAVIKRLRANLADDSSFRNMFLDEARLAARLNHPNVVHTYEVGEQDGNYFIAMEYLEGQSLNKVIREAVKQGTVFDQAFCARVVSDALAGLHSAHELRDYDGRPLNIIHRDVSPHNVFVTYAGQVKLVDFGIAKAALSSTETEVGVLKGKVAYMAPEQAMGGPIDCRADIFSMGIVLWELLARQRLMSGDTAAATLHRLLNAPIPSISTVRPDVDPELESIIARALEKDPRYRFDTAQEMRDALDDFLMMTGRNVRQDEIGQQITSMFQDLREEVRAQVQAHMATVQMSPGTQELDAMGTDGSQRMPQSGTSPRGPSLIGATASRMVKLGVGSGSGSGVVPNFAGYSSGDGASIPPRLDVSPEQRKNRLIIAILAGAVGVLTLTMLAIVIVGVRRDGGTRGGDSIPIPVASPTDEAVSPGIPTQPGPSPTGVVVPQGSGGHVIVGAPTGGPSIDVEALPTATTTTPTATTRPSPQPTTRPRPHGGTTHAAATTQEKAPEKAEDGFLTLDTYPWTKVSEGSRSLGSTPLHRIPLAPGSHTLVMENAEKGIKQSFTVSIKSGETVVKKLAFE